MRCLQLAAVGAIGASAFGQNVATWFWTVADTGDGDGLIEPGEAADLTLWCGFDPPQPQDGGGFAFSHRYDIRGGDWWAAGEVEIFENLLWDGVKGGGVLDLGDNAIKQIENYQLSKLFFPDFDPSNPIELYFVRWRPDSYDGQSVTVGNDGPDITVWTDPWGRTLDYEGAAGAVTFRVAPSPGVLVVAIVAGALGARRRRGQGHPFGVRGRA